MGLGACGVCFFFLSLFFSFLSLLFALLSLFLLHSLSIFYCLLFSNIGFLWFLRKREKERREEWESGRLKKSEKEKKIPNLQKSPSPNLFKNFQGVEMNKEQKMTEIDIFSPKQHHFRASLLLTRVISLWQIQK